MLLARTNFACGLAAAALAACGTGPEVRADYDRSAPFDRYETFAFETPSGTDRPGYQAPVTRYLKVAARRELEARGMRYDEKSPQLRVNFNAKLADKTSVNAPEPIAGGYYGYRRGSYSTWSGYPWSETAMSYTQGTLNIDVVDTARRQLVWEGVVVGVVGDAQLANLQGAVDNAVKAAFERYPRAKR
jgi:hypothetical protein